MPTIAASQFVHRQTKESPFSYYAGEWGDLEILATRHFAQARPGYRDGVCLVPVPPEKFYTSTVQLQEGDELEGVYAPRQPGEAPRKQVWKKNGEKLPAKSVELVLYRHDVLLEGNEASCDADWEIISINAHPEVEADVPMPTGTLMANHFVDSGGTTTHMTDQEFVAALKKSYFYWRDKLHCRPQIGG